ncbi:MAG: hypothetical protein QOD76_636 [Solirubrobacteraceae bacterium]|nr:hypothetical protein [Solirubrobacteraceae bacterium]
MTGATTARMVGSSIVAPSAAPWVTGFLNAAFYARPPVERRVDDLRLAHGIVATLWASRDRRLGVRDRAAFQRAFGEADRASGHSLHPAALREGGVALLGDWFREAWDDPARREYGIAFATRAARRAFDPAARLRHGALRALTPPRKPPDRQVWATYSPVSVPDPEAALAFLRDPARWPDMASAAGRFTPVRRGGLEGQTFEIHLALHPGARALFPTRGYVTCTALHTRGAALKVAIDAMREHVEAVPDGAEPLAYIELTTHRGHFMGRGISRLILYAAGGAAFVRDVGSWDPLPLHLAAAYAAGGHDAQVAFWGSEDPEAGMLAQLALVTSGDP